MAARIYLIGALAAALGLAGCGGREPELRKVETAPAAGRLTIQPQAVAEMKPAPATLTTRDMAEARARIPGTLVTLAVKEGDVVRPGQPIGRVRDDRLALQTGAFEAQAAAAAAEAARAEADLARTRTLYAQGVYAKARLDQVEAQAKAANAQLAAARAQRGASAELDAQGVILAPAAGRVLRADTPVGSVVMAGQSIATITAGPVVVRLELPEAGAGALKVGDPVRLDPRDLPGAGEGTIAEIYPAVRGGQVIADVTAPGLPRDRIGQRVRVAVKVGERQAIVVPRAYVQTRFGVDYVRLVRTDGSTAEVSVQTAPGPDEKTVEILSGLRAGDVLVPAVRR
ncbi:MAG: efflux RND transporter periplasmic adaptor subunit [Phenylobacterium sp.]|uniref:efflux RND transporter periplasmic adaptor subunit n=1 Tax=Phenylobacterium sp. TaxID=1871053 RepID=UPI00391909C1